jgi:hypothetical protein
MLSLKTDVNVPMVSNTKLGEQLVNVAVGIYKTVA